MLLFWYFPIFSEQESETDAEHIHEETHFQENEEKNEIPDIPITEEEYSEELGDKIPEVLESRGSLQEGIWNNANINVFPTTEVSYGFLKLAVIKPF